jgi:hypothetical protein
MLGSAPDAPVLLEEPRAVIVAKARVARNGRAVRPGASP